LLFAFSLTGGMILFSYFETGKGKKEKDENYSNFVKRRIIKFTFTAAVFIPVFSLANLLVLPHNSLSGSVFFYLIISLVFLFLGYHFLYLLTKELKGTFAALLFFALIFSAAANIISDQKAMANSTKVRSAVLSTEFDKYIAKLKDKGKIVELNVAEIYQVKCGSCHKFDQKLVGPPHKEVIPKYIGKEAQLVAFIRNPVKVDPAYPPMPNPGLKPNEAEAIAKYLLDTIKTINK
jgi:cytochrome c